MSRLTVAPLPERDRTGGATIVTAPFGDGRGHMGVDWGTTDGIEIGTPVHAPVDGYVCSTGYDGPWTSTGGHTAGQWLWFMGSDGTRWKMFHLDGYAIAQGDTVTAGTQIAYVGNTGTQAAHLHLEEHRDSSWSAPIDFTGDAYEVINAGRWPGTQPADPTGVGGPEDRAMVRNASNGGVYVLVHTDARGLGWWHLDGQTANDLTTLGYQVLPEIGCTGSEERDAAFGRYPILN